MAELVNAESPLQGKPRYAHVWKRVEDQGSAEFESSCRNKYMGMQRIGLSLGLKIQGHCRFKSDHAHYAIVENWFIAITQNDWTLLVRVQPMALTYAGVENWFIALAQNEWSMSVQVRPPAL